VAVENKVKVLRNSTERLLAVADIVEANDGRWNQEEWAQIIYESHATEHKDVLSVNQLHTCGSFGCIAGWSVAMHPKNFNSKTSWEEAGAKALGLSLHLAEELFAGDLGGDYGHGTVRNRRVAKVLRHLASLPVRERTYSQWENCERILDGKRPLKRLE